MITIGLGLLSFPFPSNKNLNKVLSLVTFSQTLEVRVRVYLDEFSLGILDFKNRVLHSREISWCEFLQCIEFKLVREYLSSLSIGYDCFHCFNNRLWFLEILDQVLINYLSISDAILIVALNLLTKNKTSGLNLEQGPKQI